MRLIHTLSLVVLVSTVLPACAGLQTGMLDPGRGLAPALHATSVSAVVDGAADWAAPVETSNVGGDVRVEHQLAEGLAFGVEGFGDVATHDLFTMRHPTHSLTNVGGKALATVWLTDAVSLHGAAGGARFDDSFDGRDGTDGSLNLHYHDVSHVWTGDLLLVGDLKDGGRSARADDVDAYVFGGVALTGSLDERKPFLAENPLHPTVVVGAAANIPMTKHLDFHVSAQAHSHPQGVEATGVDASILLMSVLFVETFVASAGLVATF